MDICKEIADFEEAFGNQDIDTLNQEQADNIDLLAKKLYKNTANSKKLKELESNMTKVVSKYSVPAHLAVKLALSKKYLSEIKDTVHLSIVWALYKDRKQLFRKEEDSEGKDLLIRKISQIEAITEDFPNISWDMIVVDDLCPDKSGKMAEQILAERYKGNNVEVIYLQDAIDEKLPVAKGLSSATESRKGGAIQYGMWYAAQKKKENHIIAYTDANLSINLGQIGLLVEGLLSNNSNAAIANRRKSASVVLKSRVRNVHEKLFIYLWKRVIRRLNYITDTQCGFKAFKAEVVNQIILDTLEKKQTFDIELLIKTDILKRESITKVPILWIDSETEDTLVEPQYYVDMLKGVSKMYFKYLLPNSYSHSFVFFIKSLDAKKWETLVNHVPEGIMIKSAIHYDRYDEIKVPVFEKILEDYLE